VSSFKATKGGTMKVKEAVEVLKQMNPNDEVTLHFQGNMKANVDPHDPDGGEDYDMHGHSEKRRHY
jgi:hypothetical protein